MGNRIGITAISKKVAFEKGARPYSAFGADFYRDLLGMYGETVSEESLNVTQYSTFEGLCSEAIAELGKTQDLTTVDLLILAHWMPNTVSYNSTTSYLLHRFKIPAFAFAISDQGTGAVYTALKIASDYLAQGSKKKALVVAVDQTTLPQPLKWLAEREIADTAVAIIVERSNDGSELVATDSLPQGTTGEAGDLTALANKMLADAGVAEAQVTLLSPVTDKTENLGLDFRHQRKLPTHHLVTAPLVALDEWWRIEGPIKTPYALALDQSFGRNRGVLWRLEAGGH